MDVPSAWSVCAQLPQLVGAADQTRRRGTLVLWFGSYGACPRARHRGGRGSRALRCEARRYGLPVDRTSVSDTTGTGRRHRGIAWPDAGVRRDVSRHRATSNARDDPAWVADMLLNAYAAAVDRPALITSTIEDVTGTPARTFGQWATDHAADFARS